MFSRHGLATTSSAVFSCDRAAHAVIVPPMLIQPILENALHYGAQTSSMPLRVSVTAKVADGWLESLRNYTRVALKPPGGVMLFRRRLSYWDKVLPTGLFARVGRSYIVQLAVVKQIEWSSRTETVATFGEGVEPLSLGRLPGTRLREILGGQA